MIYFTHLRTIMLKTSLFKEAFSYVSTISWWKRKTSFSRDFPISEIQSSSSSSVHNTRLWKDVYPRASTSLFRIDPLSKKWFSRVDLKVSGFSSMASAVLPLNFLWSNAKEFHMLFSCPSTPMRVLSRIYQYNLKVTNVEDLTSKKRKIIKIYQILLKDEGAVNVPYIIANRGFINLKWVPYFWSI